LLSGTSIKVTQHIPAVLLYDLTPFCLTTLKFVYDTSNYLNMIWHEVKSYEKILASFHIRIGHPWYDI